MPVTAAPRSVSDATRFTAATPHASSKTAIPRFASPRSKPGGVPGSGGDGDPGIVETPEQRVARLRAAHRRAKEAQISKFDKIVDVGRRVFDSAHRITVFGLVIFTGVAAVATVYTAYDMIRYNKKRTREWIEAQKKFEADSLEAARIAYMTGKATEEQIALVEEQIERERESGRKTSFFSNISVLSTPEPATKSTSNPATATAGSPAASGSGRSITETVSWPTSERQQQQPSQETADSQQPQQQPHKTGLWAWLTSNLKKQEESSSLSEEDDAAGVRNSDIVRAVEQKAHAAFEKEKQNQRQGGPLDRVGIEQQQDKPAAAPTTTGQEEPPKKGWW